MHEREEDRGRQQKVLRLAQNGSFGVRYELDQHKFFDQSKRFLG